MNTAFHPVKSGALVTFSVLMLFVLSLASTPLFAISNEDYSKADSILRQMKSISDEIKEWKQAIKTYKEEDMDWRIEEAQRLIDELMVEKTELESEYESLVATLSEADKNTLMHLRNRILYPHPRP